MTVGEENEAGCPDQAPNLSADPVYPCSTSAIPPVPLSRPRPWLGRPPASGSGSGLAVRAAAPASAPRSTPAEEGTMGSAEGLESFWGSRCGLARH